MNEFDNTTLGNLKYIYENGKHTFNLDYLFKIQFYKYDNENLLFTKDYIIEVLNIC